MNAEEKVAKLDALIAEGRTVYFQTALRTTVVTPKTYAAFAAEGRPVWKAKNGSLYIIERRSYVCADYCRVTAR